MERCELERIKEMKEFLGNTEETLLIKWIDKIQSFCMNDKKIKKDFLNIIEELMIGKEDGCIAISYLRSSYITGSHEFCIAYYAGEPFVEEEPDSRFYSLSSILEGIESDIECMNKELENKYIRILKSEKEELRRWFTNNIYMKLGVVFKLIFGDIQMKGDVDVFYGSYMGELELLGKI